MTLPQQLTALLLPFSLILRLHLALLLTKTRTYVHQMTSTESFRAALLIMFQ